MHTSPICFINLDSINVTPYFKYYEQCLSSSYDLIYWSRSKQDAFTGAENVYCFQHEVELGNKMRWLRQLSSGYLGFRRFAKRILIQNKYAFVVALTGNAAVLLSDVLCDVYPGKYIIDIRDYFLEDLLPYRLLEERAIDHSAMTVISSPDYVHFLGDHRFCVMHNTQSISQRDIVSIQEAERPSMPFVIASIGTAKNISLDKQVINYFANDRRFQLRFIGRGYEQLIPYCKQHGIRNVIAKGEFQSADTVNLYKDVDAIMSMYGSKKTHFRYQLTNKLYFATQLEIPIIVSPNTTMARMTNDYSLGLVLDLNREASKEDILDLYNKDLLHKRREGAKEFLESAQADNEKVLSNIKKLFMSRQTL